MKTLTLDVREKREAVHEAQANLKRAEENLEVRGMIWVHQAWEP